MKPIRLPCHLVLPAVYDDSLSYYEQVLKLVDKTNELVDEINDLQEKYTEILSYYKNIDRTIDERISVKFAQLKAQLDVELNAIIAKLNTLETLVNNYYRASKNYTDSAIAGCEFRLRDEISELAGKIELELEEIRKEIADGMKMVQIYNPTTGFKSDIETCLADVYESARIDEGLTVSEYSSYGITVNDYSHYNMTVAEYAMTGKKIIERFYKWFFNPFTGIKNTVANISSWCATELLNTFTVNEYSALNLSVNDYNERNYTVRDYLEANRGSRQVLTLGGNGLTSNQYETIGVTNL